MRKTILLAIGCALLWAAEAAAQSAGDFDHVGTRFPLTGAHERVNCEACHQDGIFQGTPTKCGFCHDGTGTRAETGKPRNHIRSSDRCEDCHTTNAWTQVRFDHGAVTGTCESCHDGFQAAGKGPRHIQTRESCDRCHITLAWTPVRFDHSGVTAPCSTCHNGVDATGKNRNHIATTAECDDCHSTRAWTPARFDHSGVTGSCASCHNGMQATGKPGNHFQTNEDCSTCHVVRTWSNVRFTHTSGNYPGDHRRNLGCRDCHRNNMAQNPWTYPTYAPDCAGCHANRFERDAHRKIESPRTSYTVSELRDCTGSCHTYTDATLSQISRSRPGPQHRVTSGEFGD